MGLPSHHLENVELKGFRVHMYAASSPRHHRSPLLGPMKTFVFFSHPVRSKHGVGMSAEQNKNKGQASFTTWPRR